MIKNNFTSKREMEVPVTQSKAKRRKSLSVRHKSHEWVFDCMEATCHLIKQIAPSFSPSSPITQNLEPTILPFSSHSILWSLPHFILLVLETRKYFFWVNMFGIWIVVHCFRVLRFYFILDKKKSY
jgi:hypothetical protein